MMWFSIFTGGGIGSLLRYLLSARVGNHWGIMTVNLLGAFLIGAVYGLCLQLLNLSSETKAFIITGMLGGFTTFSTFMLDFGLLMNQQKYAEACLYLAGSVLLGILFLYLGMLSVRIWE